MWDAAKHLKCHINDIIDLSSNVATINPGIFPNKPVLETIHQLPEPYSHSLCQQYRSTHCQPEDAVVAGAGTTELIDHICRHFAGQSTLIYQPTYADYEKFATIHQHRIHFITTSWETDFQIFPDQDIDFIQKHQLVFLCNPNNPTGKLIQKASIISAAQQCPNTMFVVDESYMPFTNESESLLKTYLHNILILRSFSKIYGIPGVRMGFMITRNHSFASQLKAGLSEWSVNTLAQEMGSHLLTQPQTPHDTQLKQHVISQLSQIDGISLLTSDCHFFLIDTGIPAATVKRKLQQHRILVRNCNNFRNIPDTVIRISIKTETEMSFFIHRFNQLIREYV